MGNICCKSRKKNLIDKINVSSSSSEQKITNSPKHIKLNPVEEEQHCLKYKCIEEEVKEPLKTQILIEEEIKINTNKSLLVQEGTNEMVCENIVKDTGKIIDNKEDEENSLIENTLIITVNKLHSNKNFLILEEYLQELENAKLDLSLRCNDLDNILLHLINNENKKNVILTYFFQSYKRGYQYILKKIKLDKGKILLKIIANYILLISNNPENFGLEISGNQVMNIFINFFNESDEDQIVSLLLEIVNSISKNDSDHILIVKFFDKIFEVVHKINYENIHPEYFESTKIRKNLKILIKLSEKSPYIAELYCSNVRFNPQISQRNGKVFQVNSTLSLFFSLSPLDWEPKRMMQLINTTNNNEAFSSLKLLISKINPFLNETSRFIRLLFNASEISRLETLKYLFDAVRLNIERNKTFFNNFTVSSLGFLLCISHIALNLLFTNENGKKIENINDLIREIDFDFCLNNSIIDFSKFEKISILSVEEANSVIDKYKKILEISSCSSKTYLYFIIHIILHYYLRNLDEEYVKILQHVHLFINTARTNDPRYKEVVSLSKIIESYIRKDDFVKNLIRFNEITVHHILSTFKENEFLSGKTISQLELNEEFLNIDEVFSFKILPNFLIKNLVFSIVILRRGNYEIIIRENKSFKLFSHFSLVFSTLRKIIKNPYLRNEIFDILYFIISINPAEYIIPNITELHSFLSDQFIQKHILKVIIRIFNDAERSEAQIQYLEKFPLRNKVLYLFNENIIKYNRAYYTKQFVEILSIRSEECSLMIISLLNDMSFLNEESITKLWEIKKFQELSSDMEKFNKLDPEVRNFEKEKFINNDRNAKLEIKFFKEYLTFLLFLCKQCKIDFITYSLQEKLVEIVNYIFGIYTGVRGRIGLKNNKEYEFDPKSVILSLISIFCSFRDCDDILRLIVKDERSFNFKNFEYVLAMHQNGEITINYEEKTQLSKIVEKFKVFSLELNSKKVNYDDACDEFLDPITFQLMDDPVMLPSSKTVVDRKTIETHLTKDKTDPFNRSLLTSEMLVSCNDLKYRIEEYKKGKKIY